LPCLLALAPARAAVPKNDKPRLMISEFPVAKGAYEGWNGWGMGGSEARVSDVLQDLMVTAMIEKAGDKVRLMERKQLESVLAEQKLGASGLMDENTAVVMGKLVGCQYMIAGKVTRFAYKKSGFGTGWGVSALVSKVPGMGGAAASAAGDIHVSKASFTGRLDCRLIDLTTGEIILVAHNEGQVKDVGVKVAGTGSDIQFDQELVNKIFEPIATSIATKLAARLTQLKEAGELQLTPPKPPTAAQLAELRKPAAPAPAPAPAVPQAAAPQAAFVMPQGTGIDPVDPAMLKALLPETALGYGRNSQDAVKTGAGTFKVSKASSAFGDKQGHKVELTIMDIAGAASSGMLTMWANTEQDRQTDGGYEKMYKAGGRAVHERWEKSGSGEYQVLVAARFVVEAHGTQVDMASLKRTVELVDFKKLEAMKGIGMPGAAAQP
jgi:curli biogenesis system outer membrane secretion channel CsgG